MKRTTAQTFKLYWLREAACDAGTPVTASELEPAIRDRVLQLAETTRGITLRLPFLDRREWPKRDRILHATPLERTGDLIRAVLDPASATRDTAATLVLTDPTWKQARQPNHYDYFVTWQKVSLALQRALKRGIAAEYLGDPERCADRRTGYAVVAYQASRPCYGRPCTEFTYDLRDYPDCRSTLSEAFKMTGRNTQAALAQLEIQLIDSGRPDIARRYAPVWYEDVLVAARRKPRLLVELLAKESAIVNAVIDLGSDPTVAMVNRSSRIINTSLRNVLGLDMRKLGAVVLEEVAGVLTRLQAGTFNGGLDHHLDLGALEYMDARPTRRPHARVA